MGEARFCLRVATTRQVGCVRSDGGVFFMSGDRGKVSHGRGSIQYDIGVFFVVLALLGPLLCCVIPWLGLPKKTSGTAIALILAVSPEFCLFLGALCGGKELVHRFEERFKSIFRMKRVRRPVSRGRHHIGLVTLAVGVLVPWVLVYLPYVEAVPPGSKVVLFMHISSDLLFFGSFFILGPEFWEKVKNLFRWEPVG